MVLGLVMVFHPREICLTWFYFFSNEILFLHHYNIDNYRYLLVVELFYVPYMVLQISTFFLFNLTKCSSFLISSCHLLYNKLFVSVRRQMFSFSPTQLTILNWIKFKKNKPDFNNNQSNRHVPFLRRMTYFSAALHDTSPGLMECFATQQSITKCTFSFLLCFKFNVTIQT